jgi:hypothetical protein
MHPFAGADRQLLPDSLKIGFNLSQFGALARSGRLPW